MASHHEQRFWGSKGERPDENVQAEVAPKTAFIRNSDFFIAQIARPT